jgi:hypothetical protein
LSVYVVAGRLGVAALAAFCVAAAPAPAPPTPPPKPTLRPPPGSGAGPTPAASKASNPALARARKLLAASDYPALAKAAAAAASYPGVDLPELREALLLGAIAALVMGDAAGARAAVRAALAIGADLAADLPAETPPRALVFFDGVLARDGPVAPVRVWLAPGGEAGATAVLVRVVDTEHLVAHVHLYVRKLGDDTYELRTVAAYDTGALGAAAVPAPPFEYFLVAETATHTAVAAAGDAGAPARWPPGAVLERAAAARAPAAAAGASAAPDAAGAAGGDSPAVGASPPPPADRLTVDRVARSPLVWIVVGGALAATLATALVAELVPFNGR